MAISSRSLIQLCQRVSSAVRSGVDARRVWEIEERHASGRHQEALRVIGQHVARGGSIAEGMHASGGYFPSLLVQMVGVGEQTGKLDEVLARLGRHYQHMADMRRAFWTGIAWPLFELVFAVLIIGFLIFILGIISTARGGEPLDVLGLGLVGTTGAIAWFLICGLLATAVVLAVLSVARGWLGPQPVLAAMRIPVLGKCLESLALSRLTWALALALDSGMDARRAVTLAIRSAQNPYYESSLPRVAESIRANRQFYESFADGGVFPGEFIQQLEVAEVAGTTTESLLRLAQEYEDRARQALRVLTGFATVAVMLLVFGLIVFVILMMAWHLYMKPIYETLDSINSGRI